MRCANASSKGDKIWLAWMEPIRAHHDQWGMLLSLPSQGREFSGRSGAFIMQTCNVAIINRFGLHARAAAKVVRLASQFRCSVSLVFNGRRASARSMLAVMMLAASMGSVVRLETSGPDEAAAMTAMVKLIGNGFGEQK